jgi:hypothetical protein
MSKKGWIITIVIAIIEIVIGGWFVVPHLLEGMPTQTAWPTQVKPTQTAMWLEGKPTGTLSPTVGDALTAMLTSHLKWDTLQGNAEFIWYTSEGGPKTYIKSFALQQHFKGRVVIKSVDGRGSECTWISDGENYSIYYPASQSYYTNSVTDLLLNLSLQPATLEYPNTADELYRNQFSLIIPSYLVDYLFPQKIAEEGGIYILAGEEMFLERKVWIVEHQIDTVMSTVWVDQETGVILKYIQYTDGEPFLKVTFMSFFVNQAIDPSLFVLPQDMEEEK